MSFITSISGVRGLAGETFHKDTIEKYAYAFSLIQKPGPFLIARDGRKHGVEYSEILKNFLINFCGRDVIQCDIVPTPTAQFIVEKNSYSGGIVITASHNPIEWSGLKFIDNNGCFINARKYKKLSNTLKEIDSSNIKYKNNTPDCNQSETLFYNDKAIKKHLNNILNLSAINLNRIKKKNFKVVVDAVNSSTSKILPMLLEKFNCRVTELNCESNGDFLRGAEPLPHNLSDISEVVIKTKSDLGIASDPDGDRLAIIDENGTPIGEESTLVICCDSLLKDNLISTPIITNLSTSMAIDKLANQYNIDVLRTDVGEINVVKEMKNKKAIIGGEGNGGVILPESHYGRDSLVATALLLNRLSKNNISVSQLYNKIPHYTIIKDFIKTEKAPDQKFINKLIKKLNPLETNKMDGVKLIWANKWIHIRKSNTEPIVRFYSEAENINDSTHLIDVAKKLFTY